uniref:Potassium channel domain-containing protein n=1 Tax=Wuchereria bancrofti TaxID=6293 RepID=A0A1I8EE87_WUCBA
AERLNYFIGQQDGEGGILEQIGEDRPTDFAIKTHKDQIRRKLRIVLPHIGLVLLSTAYTILGAAIFHHFEMPYEVYIRNETAHRIETLKQKIIDNLWMLVQMRNNSREVTFETWSKTAHLGINDVIRDVFIDYTKNYMTPDDIIKGAGPVKWSFGSSVFFSWTAITTIGKNCFGQIVPFISATLSSFSSFEMNFDLNLGYGHIVPRTNEGRIACLMYALLGIPLILVTIADIGRFLSGNARYSLGSLHDKIGTFGIVPKSRTILRILLQMHPFYQKKKQPKTMSANDIANIKRSKRRRQNHIDTISEAGTFEDISEIHTQESEKTISEDTQARADELEEYESHHDRRISVLFVLIIMIGYTAGGACLMQLWENWTFMESFYFCFVTVTTIGFGDIVPQNADFLPATLMYIIIGLIITTMCIGSEYIRDIHFYGRSLGRSFMTIGGKVVHLGEVFGYVAFLQKKYGLTAEQINKLAQLPEEYLLECLINGRQPDLNWIDGRPYVPPDIYYFKWIEHPRTLSFVSERVLASMESLDLNTSKCSTARTLTPREYYQRILLQYCKQIQPTGQQQQSSDTQV